MLLMGSCNGHGNSFHDKKAINLAPPAAKECHRYLEFHSGEDLAGGGNGADPCEWGALPTFSSLQKVLLVKALFK